MRIISGKAKGLRLSTPQSKTKIIRPTSERSREALFSILANQIVDARILDLFAGTGALGIEGLSRGAKSAVFIDAHKASLSLINKNVSLFLNCCQNQPLEPEINIIKGELPGALSYLLRDEQKEQQCFDVIFIDPPYDRGLIPRTLEYIDNNGNLSNNGVVIVEERSNSFMEQSCGNLYLSDQRTYGDTGFWFYRQMH